MRNVGNETGDVQEKRKKDEPKGLKSRLIDADMEKQLIEVGGFTKQQLHNRRGTPAERGLGTLLEKDDQILEVLPGKVRIKTREGTVQTFYNLDAPQDFLKPVEPRKSNEKSDPEPNSGIS